MNERLVVGVAVREWGDPADPATLLWPGLSSTSAYFANVAPALPGRAVAVDPAGFGHSAPLDGYTSERLVAIAWMRAGFVRVGRFPAAPTRSASRCSCCVAADRA